MSKPETWKTWEGRSVNGKFPLRQWLGGSEHSAVFLSEKPGQSSEKVAIKLIETDATRTESQITQLRSTLKLSHPHLIRTFETGRSQIDGTNFVYVVMECADEDLSQILPQRALAPAEVSELLPPLLDALAYLHNKNLVHGRIKPSNVLAVGDQLKLSSDQVSTVAESNGGLRRRDVYDAPETAAGIISPAGDVWSIGVMLVAAITQDVTLAEKTSPGSPSLPDTIPEPFRGIAKECLQLDPKRRCSLAQIHARLQPPARSVPEPAAVAPPKPARQYRYSWRMLIPVAVVLAIVLGWRVFRVSSAPEDSAKPAPVTQPEKPAERPPVESKPSPAPPSATSTPVPEPAKPAPHPTGAGGEVRHRVLPEIPRSAENTIHGTIKIVVQVDVDASGKVTNARLKTAGPSHYFAGKVLAAAQGWEFSPPQSGGQPTASEWLLQFHLRRGGVDVTPQQIKR